jgi:hypothetical protein
VSGLVSVVVAHVLSLALAFVLGMIVDALAPTFGGTRNLIDAPQIVAYGSTAVFLGAVSGLMMPARGMHTGDPPCPVVSSGDVTVKTLAGERSIGGSTMEGAARQMKEYGVLV